MRMQAEFVDDGSMDLEMQQLLVPDQDNHGGGGSSPAAAVQVLHRAILILRTLDMFIAGLTVVVDHDGSSLPAAAVSTTSKSSILSNHLLDHLEQHAETDIMEVDAAQTTPLLNTVENSLPSIRTLTHVHRSILVFKAHAAASFRDHGNSDASQLGHCQRENISRIVREKNLLTFREFGGLSAVEIALNTNLVTGISGHEAKCRLSECHQYQAPTMHTYFQLIRDSLMTKTILLLSLAIFLSIILGINQEGIKYGWHDGAAVLIVIILLVFLASIRKCWQEQRTRKKLKQPQRLVKNVLVIREDGDDLESETELVYGDIVLLKQGCQVPADGLFVDGETIGLDYGSEPHIINQDNPFLSYGERVINGNARMVVTSINLDNTGWSEMMRKASDCGTETRFNLKMVIDKLNTCLHYTALVIGILIVLVLIFRYMGGKLDDESYNEPGSMGVPTATRTFASSFRKIMKDSKNKARALTKLLSVSLVGVTEGVTFVVSLAIFYQNDKALSGKVAERNSQCVANMASVTRICTDMFGDFTENEIEVENLFIGREVINWCTALSPDVVQELRDGIATSKEQALLHWAKGRLGLESERMREIEESERMIERLNGPSKEILSKCSHYFDSKGNRVPLDPEAKLFFDDVDEDMQHQELARIAFARKDTDIQTQDENNFILVALLDLKSKNKEATKAQVKAFEERGIKTVIVSSKKLSVVQHIALQCEVNTNDDSEPRVITGKDLRKYTDTERLEKVDKIRVLGEATPSDKLLLVETLREKGEVVAFLGQRTDEAPAITGADIGIAMGTWSSMKARESCDIFIPDGSFSELISMVDSGKCIYHNIQSFLQLVLILTASSTLINFIETAAFGDASLTLVQLVWVNFAVDFLGGFALLTKPSTDKDASFGPKRSLITAQMTRNILLQVLFQALCSVIIQLKASAVLGTTDNTKTIASNIFIFCQFFNQFNARELQNKNFFKGIHGHKAFWVAITMFIVLHATFVMVQDTFGYGTRLNWKLWAGCVLVAAVSWLVDWLGKCIAWFIGILISRLRHT